MLRPRPTEIALTLNDISQATERIAARRRAAGKAHIRQGAERSRDEAMRTLNRVLAYPQAMRASVSNSEQEPIESLQAPKILLTRAEGRTRTRQGVESDRHGSSEAGSGDAFDLVVPQQRVPSQSRTEISQLHLDGQVDCASGLLSLPFQQRTTSLLAVSVTMNNRQSSDIPRMRLYQSHVMSSPNISRSTVSPQHRYWRARPRQLSDSSVGLQHSIESE
jgi:hypothetical protein